MQGRGQEGLRHGFVQELVRLPTLPYLMLRKWMLDLYSGSLMELGRLEWNWTYEPLE